MFPPLRFQPQRRAADPSLQAAIRLLSRHLLGQEAPTRVRRRSAKGGEHFMTAVEAVVCNLLRLELAAPSDAEHATLAVPRSNEVLQGGPSRYRSHTYGQHFRDALDRMEELGFIATVTKGFNVRQFQRRAFTTIKPRWNELAGYLIPTAFGIEACIVGSSPETIVLKDRESKQALDYEETEDTNRWRQELATINAALRIAPITLVDHPPADEEGYRPSADDRALRRIFSGSFEQGGRLYDGFWMNMARQDRYRCIRIGGEPVVNIDLQQCHLRLAYAVAGAIVPEREGVDLYVAGDGDREGYKRVTNALFNREKSRNAWPVRSPRERKAMESFFPPDTHPATVIAAIKCKHAPIAHLFDCGIGLRFQRREADILVAAMLRLIAEGIPALPLHDSVIVAARHSAAATLILEAEALKHTRVTIPTKIETAAGAV